jgi:signal transduction histidine kinase
MRAPLSVMKLRIALARRNLARIPPPDLNQILALLDEQVDRLNAMVNDMLDVSRAQAGTLHVELETVALEPLITALVSGLAETAPNHTLVTDLEELTVTCDRMRTEQVLTNLIGNAIRYSGGGEVRITLRRKDNKARIDVTDQGRGLDEALLPHLFEPFTRAHNDAAREGGLGLYLSREMVRRMNGEIWASSRGLDQGSTFSFTLPIAPG